MKKIFPTSKTKEELEAEIDNMRADYSKPAYKRKNLMIRFIGQNKVRISCGSITYWKYNFDKQGEINISRYFTIMDWIEIIAMFTINIIFSFLFLYNRLSLDVIFVLLALIVCEVFPIYYLYVICPIGIIKRFIQKYLE